MKPTCTDCRNLLGPISDICRELHPDAWICPIFEPKDRCESCINAQLNMECSGRAVFRFPADYECCFMNPQFPHGRGCGEYYKGGK